MVASLEQIVLLDHVRLHTDAHLGAERGLERLQHLRIVHIPPGGLHRQHLKPSFLQSGGHGVDAAKFGPLVHLGVVVLPNAVGVLDDGADVTDEEGVEAEPHGDGEHGGPDLGDGGGVEVAGLGALRQQAGEAGVCAEGVLHYDWLIRKSACVHPRAAHDVRDVKHDAGVPMGENDGEEKQKHRAQDGARDGQHVAPAHEVAEEARRPQELDHGHHWHQNAGLPIVM
mmetsp:Transcript_19675/g.35130  ORF Transcript_19675/g.35130 Transcript_19675/m.35130 type:complete len:227 (+) Transcript_19675:879-1559(+)